MAQWFLWLQWSNSAMGKAPKVGPHVAQRICETSGPGKKSNLHIPTYLHSIQIRKHGPGHLDVLLGWSCELPCENLQSKQCGRQLELALSTSANRQNLRKWKWWNMVDVYIYIIVPWCMCKYIIYILDSCNTSFVTLDLKVFLTIWLSQYVHKLSFHFQGQKAWTLLSFRAHLLPKGMGQHGSSLPAVQLAWTQDSSEIKSKVLFQKIQISLGSSGTGREQRVNWRA